MEIRTFQSADQEAVVDVWHRCELLRTSIDPRETIRRKVEFQPDLFLAGLEDGKVVATVMGGYEGRRGWVNYVGVAPAYRGRGFGRALRADL